MSTPANCEPLPLQLPWSCCRAARSATVSLPYDAALGVGALVLYNAIIAVVGLVNRFTIPSRFYLFARAWYCAYLAAAAALAMGTS